MKKLLIPLLITFFLTGFFLTQRVFADTDMDIEINSSNGSYELKIDDGEVEEFEINGDDVEGDVNLSSFYSLLPVNVSFPSDNDEGDTSVKVNISQDDTVIEMPDDLDVDTTVETGDGKSSISVQSNTSGGSQSVIIDSTTSAEISISHTEGSEPSEDGKIEVQINGESIEVNSDSDEHVDYVDEDIEDIGDAKSFWAEKLDAIKDFFVSLFDRLF